jgi:hypothetical protein
MGRAQGRQQLLAATGPRGPRRAYTWTPERIEEELAEFLGDREDWPTSEEFRTAGQRNLISAVERSPGGVVYWATRMNRRLGPMQNRAAYPLHIALAEAQELIAEHGKLPNINKLRALGHPRLAYLVQREGGSRAFSAKHKLLG